VRGYASTTTGSGHDNLEKKRFLFYLPAGYLQPYPNPDKPEPKF